VIGGELGVVAGAGPHAASSIAEPTSEPIRRVRIGSRSEVAV
jgi:hypothetical protein